MSVLDPRAIRAAAEKVLGPLAEGPASYGVLPEGIFYETVSREKRRLLRSEPCLFLGPPARSRLVLVAAILDRSETAEDPVRELVQVAVVDLRGVWPSGLEDAFTRFAAKDVEATRPELLALEAGTLVWRLGETHATELPHATPAVAVGRERAGRHRRALVLVRGTATLEPVYFEDGVKPGE